MADFCLACARDNGDPTDLAAGLGPRAEVLCEGCGPIVVDEAGRCLSAGCLAAGRPGHGGLAVSVVPIGARRHSTAAPSPLFNATPPPREREPQPPRIIALVVLALREDRGPVGACLVVVAGDRRGETPVWCHVSGARAVREWLEHFEALHPPPRDEVPRTFVTEGPEYDRAIDVAEQEFSRGIAWAVEQRRRRA